MDSGWLKELRETGLPGFILAAAGLGGLAVIWQFSPEWLPQPFAGAQAWFATAAVGCLIVSMAWGSWLIIKSAKRLPTGLTRLRLRRRYASLNEQQKNLLRGVYQRGSRNFDMHSISDRWFEELDEMGFVEFVHVPIFVSGSPLPYKVTLPAWQALGRLDQRKKL